MSTMNLLLHQVDVPHLVLDNALNKMITEKSKASLVDVVLTNPPFGGAESSDVVKAFPAGFQTAETAWLFLYTVMEKLRPGGRCGIVVPNSVLFEGGIGARVKERLLSTCNLHTIVRLPEGVFAPYTGISANLLFFEKGKPTTQTWFYEMRPPEGRKRYSKTKPLQYDELQTCREWWGGPRRKGRVTSDSAWCVPVQEIREGGLNLGLRHPSSQDGSSQISPRELVKELIASELEILSTMEEIEGSLSGSRMRGGSAPGSIDKNSSSAVATVRLGDLLDLVRNPISIDPALSYSAIGIRSFGNGMIVYPSVPAAERSKLRYFRFPASALAVATSRISTYSCSVLPLRRRDFVNLEALRLALHIAIVRFRLTGSTKYGSHCLIRTSNVASSTCLTR